MSSSTHKSQQNYEKVGFYPFNGVAMWKRKISIYKSFTIFFFAFLCKNKTEKSQWIRQMKIKDLLEAFIKQRKNKKEENKSCSRD